MARDVLILLPVIPFECIAGKSLEREKRKMSATSSNDSTAPRRVMAYCHDSVGIGHLRRTMAICDRIGQDFGEASFLLATGTPYVPLFRDIARVDYVKLPALKKECNGAYGSKYLNITLKRIVKCRESMLLEAAKHYEPDVFLVDKAPLGVCRELVPALNWLKANRPQTRIIFGMRDIEDEPEATIEQWNRDGVAEVLARCFDEVWVYGMQDVFDAVAKYRLPHDVAEKTRYMGYIARTPDEAYLNRKASDRVVVTVGGGTDGELVLETFLADAASKLSKEGTPCTIVGGPDLPESARTRLKRQANAIPGVTWLDFEPDMSRLFTDARLVVCMGGYNTLCELVSLRRRALVIPRIQPRLEQAIRAACWEARGALRMLHPDQLTPSTLTKRLREMRDENESQAMPLLDLGGLTRVADRFREFWRKDQCHASAICL